MATTNLDSLPKELTAYIASFTNASAALNLSATCRSIRAACWDPLTFKNILIASQHRYWDDESLDMEAIASKAGDDVTTWARFALADNRAASLAQSIPDDPTWLRTHPEHPLKQPRSYISYLPELFVAKHPFMFHEVWETGVLYSRQANPSQIFCLALTILASKSNNLVNVIQRLYSARSDWFLHSADTGAFLWALCTIALWARTKIQQRLAAWPYNAAARVPFIPVPPAQQIPIRPLGEGYDVPAPFSRRPAELLGKPTSSFSSWDSWYRQHNIAALKHLTEGSWCGYSIHFGVQSEINVPIDAPMMNIQFELDNTPTDQTSTETLHFRANDCLDSVDNFTVTGSITILNNDVKISARKEYQTRQWGCDWDCRLTPFGIVGFWGTRVQRNIAEGGPRLYDRMTAYGRDPDALERAGIVWLWKRAWTEDMQA